MNKKSVLFLLLFLFVSNCVFANAATDYLFETAKKEYDDKDYQQALYLFQTIEAMDPNEQKVREYIQQIKRILDGTATEHVLIADKEEDNFSSYSKLLDQEQEELIAKKQKTQKAAEAAEEVAKRPVVRGIRVPDTTTKTTKEKKRFWSKLFKKANPGSQIGKTKIITIELNDDIKDQFPLTVELMPNEKFKVHAKTIRRFLPVAPDVSSAKRIDNRLIEITAHKLGNSYIHVWTETGRWTFVVKVIPHRLKPIEEKMWEKAEGLTFRFRNNWNSNSSGESFSDTKRTSLTYNQSLNVSGPTSYGDFAGSVGWNRENKQLRTTSKRVSLTNGKLGFLNDFDVHAIDVSASLSPYTLSGMQLKGLTFYTPVYNEKLDYKVVYGREKGTYFGDLTSNAETKKKSYVEGVRVGFLPKEKHSMFFNYVTAYGESRSNKLREKAFAIETINKFTNLDIKTELGHDENNIAATIKTSYRFPNSTVRLDLRRVDRDYKTITGTGAYAGERGGRLSYNAKPHEKFYYNFAIDAYREMEDYNPDDPKRYNINANSFFNLKFTDTFNFNQQFYYANTKGTSSPYKSYSSTSKFVKNFKLDKFSLRNFQTNVGYTHQKSTNYLSEISNYQRDTAFAGLRLSFKNNLSFFYNYQYTHVKEIGLGEKSSPRVADMGADYFHVFGPKLTFSSRIYYRDEEENKTPHSFLSGEDSLEANVGLTYSPVDGTEFYFDGMARNTWAETAGVDKKSEVSVRIGSSISWESFIRWAPATVISGQFFCDTNGNGIKDPNELVVPDVRILAGTKKVWTDEEGRYKLKVRAKKVRVKVDLGTLPAGFVLSTPSAYDLDTAKGGKKEINFAVSSQSGISGVVYYDVNSNDKFDKADILLPQVKVLLDRKRATLTNSSGMYFFQNISAGKHTVQIDINSLDMQYLPKGKVRRKIEVIEGLMYTNNFAVKKK